MNMLVIIPARAGSKGIPQKNIRFLNGKPLIYYAIRNALQLEGADVFVSTDSKDIAHVAEILGAKVLIRDGYADDNSTLDEVISYELQKLQQEGKQYDTVITIQPTSPLLNSKTLSAALNYYQDNQLTSLISATPTRHLSWKKSNGNFTPLYEKRVNRQLLEPTYQENGAFLICKASHVLEHGTRISDDVKIYSIEDIESVDIDTKNDWILAENILRRRNVAVVTNGNLVMGMGHIYRSLTLSAKFNNDNVLFFSHADNRLGIEKIRSLNYPTKEYDNNEHLIVELKKNNIDLVINDTLDTDVEYMRRLNEENIFSVNFEDTGRGAYLANIVINALYEWTDNVSDNYFGYKYEVLREDIYLYPIKDEVSDSINNIMIGFGGTDPENATLTVLEALVRVADPNVNITLVLGVGYKYEDELWRYLNTIPDSKVMVVKDVYAMADYLWKSDLVISGNGRMVYETVALGVPLIVVSQNEREMSHIFPRVCKGISYQGYVKTLDLSKLQSEILMFSQVTYRKAMHAELRKKAYEIRQGVNRVINIINQKYDDAKH